MYCCDYMSVERSENNKKINNENIPPLRYDGFCDEWIEKYLKDVCVINPKTEVPELFNYIDLESVKSGILTDSKKINKNNAPSRAQRKLDKKDILFATVRPYQQNNYYFNLDGTYVASTGYAQIRSKENSEYLYYFLHTKQFLNEVMKRCTGTSYPAINSNDLKTIKIKIPSTEEQEKIASLFSHIDNKIEFMEKKYNYLFVLKDYFLKNMFCYNKNIPYMRFNGFDEEWDVIKLKDCCTITMGQSPSSTNYTNNPKETILIQGNQELIDGLVVPRVYTTEITKISTPGDIIFTVRAPVGDIAINNYNACIGRGVCSLSDMDNNTFIYYYLEYLSNMHVWNRYSQGSTFESINSKDIKNLKIKLPSLKEQNKISDLISAIDEKISFMEKEIKLQKNFKKLLLSKMFC